MNNFERYLALWVALCMVLGIVLSQTVPGISEAIDSWQINGVSIPIAICLFLMMYPALLNLQMAELRKLRNDPTPIWTLENHKLGSELNINRIVAGLGYEHTHIPTQAVSTRTL